MNLRLAPLVALCLAVFAARSLAQTPTCQLVWAQNVVSSTVGSNASGNSSGPASALGDTIDDFFALGDGGKIVVDFGQPFSNTGDSGPDVCVDEWGVADCYYVCFDPADSFTEAALIAAGMTGGPTWYEFSTTWCGDADIDLDALVPGYAVGQLKFDKVMVLDDSNGGDGAEVDRVCANVCTYPPTPGPGPGACTTVWASMVEGSNQGANAETNHANPADALGNDTSTYFNLGDGGNLAVSFGQDFTTSGDSQIDLCIREYSNNDCYYICFDPADAFTENAIIAAGMTGGPTWYEFSMTWCGNEDIDLDALIPGYNPGELKFTKVMILDDGNGSDGAEPSAICALVCNVPPPSNCVLVWASSLVGSQQGNGPIAGHDDPTDTLGDTPTTYFSLGDGGYVRVAFADVLTNSGDSSIDLCIDEWNDNDCYYLCFTPADAATTAAVVAAGWHDNGNGTYEPFVTWCGDEDIDIDALLPGYAQGTLRFADIMVLDDMSGGNGAEVERVCGLNCVLAKIGDFVWRDSDCDGVQDQGEPGIAGLTLTLLKQSDLSVVATTVTDANGAWCFSDLQAGDYVVHLTYNQVSYALSPTSVGGDPTLDSDFDANSGAVAVSLNAGEQRTDIDAGLCVICPGPPATTVSYPHGFSSVNDPVITVSDFIPGETVTLKMHSQFPNSPGWIFYSVGPVTPFSLSGGTFYVDVLNQATNLFLVAGFFTDANGDWCYTSTDTVPLAWLGYEVVFQGRICAPTGFTGPVIFPPHLDFFSNGVVATIGCP